MKEEIPDDLTRAWLNGQLAPAEREKMERLLDSDPSLAAGMARRRAEMAVSELLIAAETRNLFREWRAESPQPLPGVKPAVWLAGIVAGFVLMAVAVWLVCFPPGAPALPAENPSPKLQPTPPASSAPIAAAPAEKPAATPAASINYRALATRYLPDPTFSKLRRTTVDTAASPYRQAQRAFEAGDYRRTIGLLAQTDSTQQQSAAFLSAHALFRLQRFAEAEAQFARLVEGNSRQYRFASEWAVLMCRLADFANHHKEARQQLDSILNNPEHPYYEQAKQLRQKMKE
jgi:hypothetical protein